MGVVAQTKHVCGWPTCPLWGNWNVCPSAVQAEKKGQGERSPGCTAGPTGRLGVKDEQKPSRGQGGAASSPQQSAPGRKEDAGAPGHHRLCGAQWKAAAGERMAVSHHSDPLEREAGAENALPPCYQ